MANFSRGITGRWVNNVVVSELSDFYHVASEIFRSMNVPLYKMEIYKFMIGHTGTIISGNNCIDMCQSVATLFGMDMTEENSVWPETVDSPVGGEQWSPRSTKFGSDSIVSVHDSSPVKKRKVLGQTDVSANKKRSLGASAGAAIELAPSSRSPRSG